MENHSFFLSWQGSSSDSKEREDTDRFIEESTAGTINKIIQEQSVDDPDAMEPEVVKELGK